MSSVQNHVISARGTGESGGKCLLGVARHRGAWRRRLGEEFGEGGGFYRVGVEGNGEEGGGLRIGRMGESGPGSLEHAVLWDGPGRQDGDGSSHWRHKLGRDCAEL